MAKYVLSLLLVCFFIERIQSNDCNFNPKHLVKHGHDLKELAFWEAKTKGIVECAQSCIRRNKCKSFHFNENSRLCQLNANNPTLSTAERGWVYSEIGGWPSQVDPHCYNNSCGENEVCIPGNSIGAQNCEHSCFSLARRCPLPVGASPDQPRTVGSIFSHTCADGLGRQYIAVCLENGQWNETIENVCQHWFCRPNYTECYLIDKLPRTYNDSKIFCENRNSSIVKAETEEENEFLKAKLRSATRGTDVCPTYGLCCFWNALYQYAGNGNETWTPNGPALTCTHYNDWGGGEPNGDFDHVSQRCTCFYRGYNYTWADTECVNPYLTLCEKKRG